MPEWAEYKAALRRVDEEWDRPGYGDWGVSQVLSDKYRALPLVLRIYVRLTQR